MRNQRTPLACEPMIFYVSIFTGQPHLTFLLNHKDGGILHPLLMDRIDDWFTSSHTVSTKSRCDAKMRSTWHSHRKGVEAKNKTARSKAPLDPSESEQSSNIINLIILENPGINGIYCQLGDYMPPFRSFRGTISTTIDAMTHLWCQPHESIPVSLWMSM